ncbi:MAG: DUF2339 domain-containing protein [Acidobacteriales bacterium]|nr:DUF2339 domain-containing protein [Terriglobales bacterium]
MSDLSQDLLELQKRLAELTQRVYRLEREAGFVAAAKPAVDPLASPIPKEPQATSTAPPMEPTAPPSVPPPLFLASTGKINSPFVESDESLESAIGSRWFNRIGVFAILIAASLLLKFAFENNYIGPAGRVAIGLIAGIVLVGWSSRLHARGNIYFSYSVTATGVGIMYLSLWAAFQLYHLVPGGVAFLAMIIVTASATALALKQDAQIIAAVALLGGLSTPALLSTGVNRPVELFSYLFLLDAAALWLVMIRPWRRLLAACFFGTMVYYAGWHGQFFTPAQRPIALFYASVFFAMFAVLPVIKLMKPEFGLHSGWAHSKTFVAVALINPFIYFMELYAIFESEPDYQSILAWASVLLGGFYIALIRTAPAPGAPGIASEDRRLQTWLHLGIALGFLTLAIPLKLEGHWITLAWLVEAAILLQVGVRLEHTFLKYAALAALMLGIFRLLFLDEFAATRILFNARFATYLVAVIVLGLIAHQVRAEGNERHWGYVWATITLNILALMALSYEARDFFYRGYLAVNAEGQNWLDFQTYRDFAYSLVWMIYGAGLMAYGFIRQVTVLRWQALVLISVVLVKVFVYDVSQLSTGLRGLSFLALGVLLLGISYVYQKDILNLSGKRS